MTKEEIFSLAIAVIVAAFIIFPAFQNFSQNVMDGFNSWYTDQVDKEIFLENGEYPHEGYTYPFK